MADPEAAWKDMVAKVTEQSNQFCNVTSCKHEHLDAETSYARHNMSPAKLSAGVGRPVITNTLKKVQNLYKSRLGSGDARTRAFYDYQVTIINMLYKK